MLDILLAKPTLPEGFIDVSVGEPHVVREKLREYFPLDHHGTIELYSPLGTQAYEYPLPTGYQPLVDLLEKKHGSPVIITNGAKQALGACFYALKQIDRHIVGMRTPYWALIPPLATIHGIECVDEYDYSFQSLLNLTPNNPDGFCDNLEDDALWCKDNGIPLIHDAAYYTHVYLPESCSLIQYGDVQIYSISKMLGLSGLRLGYVVCPNPVFYQHIKQYMETMTVGVSTLSQIYLHELLQDMQQQCAQTKNFEKAAAQALMDAKEIMMGVSPKVLKVPINLPDIPGMFLFAKIKDFSLLEKAKINAIDGKYFGAPGYVRMNLAFSAERIQEIVSRLNSVG